MDSADTKRLKTPFFSPLHEATLKGDLEEVKRLIKEGANPLDQDLYNDTLLHHAATIGELKILKYLIEDVHCVPGVKGWHGTTALHSAAHGAQFSIIRYLIEECKLDPTDVDDSDQYPLHYAYRHGNKKFVQYLMDSMRDYFKKEDVNCVLKFENIIYEIQSTYSPIPLKPYVEQFRNNASLSDLQLACKNGNLKMVHSLVSKLPHEDLSIYESMIKHNCLHLAARCGHLPVVRYFVRKLKWDPTFRDTNNDNSIDHAIRERHINILKFFFDEHGCDPDRVNSRNFTPLQVAGVAGHLSIVKYLIEEKCCNHLWTDSSRCNVLHRVAHYGHFDVFRYLVEKVKMDQNVPNNDGLTPLSFATKEGHFKIVKYLLELRTTIQYDRKSRTPLYNAALYDHLKMVKYLMSNYPAQCSCVTKLNKAFFSPLSAATLAGHYDIVKFLIEESQCDPFMLYESHELLCSGSQTTLLGIVALCKYQSLLHVDFLNIHRYQILVEYFLQMLKQKNSNSFIINFLHTQTQIGDLQALKLLIQEFDINPETPNENGTKLIFQSAYHGHIDTAKYLVAELKCNANEVDSLHKNCTPLHVSASRGHLDIVKYLIGEAGVDPYVKDDEGDTPLHFAARSNQVDIVKFLACAYRSYSYKLNSHNKTPLELAVEVRSSNTALLLIVVMFNSL